MDLELEKNKMIPGFVEGIVKMKIGDTKTLNLKFLKIILMRIQKAKKQSLK